MSSNPDPNPNPASPPAPTPPADPPTPPTPGEPTGVNIPKARFDEVNERMKAAEKELADAKAVAAKADEERLATDKKFEDLAAKRASERDEWKGKAEAAETRISTMEKRLHAIADERAKQLPEKLQARVPAADKATAEERFQELDRIADVLADVPHVAVTPGNGAMPKPAGPPGGKEAEAAARADQARLYSQF